MSLNFITGPDPSLFLKNSDISQDEDVRKSSDKENSRLVRKRQRSEASVSRLIIFHIIRSLTSDNRKLPVNFHLLHVIGSVSPAFGHKLSKTLNEETHRLWKVCDKLFKHRQHLQGGQ